ncbi:hypothetical protein [Spirillospora sp. NPDC048819]|uniref:hypothetical protein n=1 Tax=Spirillospora sp. NPDC048819 TaxID=3155268 RepID=UPI0033C5E7CB
MQPTPIQRGAIRPQGRPRRALVPVLVRLIAIAGFAFAGWLALSALNQSASAAQQPAHPGNASWTAVPEPHAPESKGLDASLVPERVREVGNRPLRQVGSPEGDLRDVRERVREIGDHPVRFLQARRHEVFERKDRTVRQVRELADAAGVPRVRLPRVRPDAPIVEGLVHDVAGLRPVMDEGLPSGAQEEPPAAEDTAQVDDGAASGVGTAAGSGHSSPMPEAFAKDQKPGHCQGCRGDGHVPGPALPSAQDNPRSGGNGGHPFSPVADLHGGRYPAAPPAVELGTFRRAALTDVSAPGGPSVVPD